MTNLEEELLEEFLRFLVRYECCDTDVYHEPIEHGYTVIDSFIKDKVTKETIHPYGYEIYYDTGNVTTVKSDCELTPEELRYESKKYGNAIGCKQILYYGSTPTKPDMYFFIQNSEIVNKIVKIEQ